MSQDGVLEGRRRWEKINQKKKSYGNESPEHILAAKILNPVQVGFVATDAERVANLVGNRCRDRVLWQAKPSSPGESIASISSGQHPKRETNRCVGPGQRGDGRKGVRSADPGR